MVRYVFGIHVFESRQLQPKFTKISFQQIMSQKIEFDISPKFCSESIYPYQSSDKYRRWHIDDTFLIFPTNLRI